MLHLLLLQHPVLASGSSRIMILLRSLALCGVWGFPVAVTAGLLLLRIPKEEQMLQSHFGRQYRDYSKRTWRLLPFIY
jgi:protein-S-isoprenylcysteine O-methyltransferase Ste14